MVIARAVAMQVDACENSEWQCKSDIRQGSIHEKLKVLSINRKQ